MCEGKAVLLYFSATSNTKLIVDEYARTFNDEGYITEIIKVEDLNKIKNINFNDVDLLGIAYPCYAFDYPKCVKQCPVNNILIIDGKAGFIDKNSCLRCMKCISNCPKDAITLGRQTEGMDRYNEKTRCRLLTGRIRQEYK